MVPTLLLARGTVMVCGIVAYVFARSADSAFELVEQASAFGSAGIFVVVVFGLFTRIGGTFTAYATLVPSVAVFSVLEFYIKAPYAYFTSFVVALVCYMAGSILERRFGAMKPAPADTAG